jgi:hypothetical protein
MDTWLLDLISFYRSGNIRGMCGSFSAHRRSTFISSNGVITDPSVNYEFERK